MSKHPFVERMLPAGREAIDVFGVKYRVFRVRPTAHGFDVLLGTPAAGGAKRSLQVIITPALKRYMLSYKSCSLENTRELPLSAATCFRIATKIETAGKRHSKSWWLSKINDLETLTLKEISLKYNISKNRICSIRQELSCNKTSVRRVTVNEITVRILESGHPTKLIADAWDVPVRAVQRARLRLRQRKDVSAFEAVP